MLRLFFKFRKVLKAPTKECGLINSNLKKHSNFLECAMEVNRQQFRPISTQTL